MQMATGWSTRCGLSDPRSMGWKGQVQPLQVMHNRALSRHHQVLERVCAAAWSTRCNPCESRSRCVQQVCVPIDDLKLYLFYFFTRLIRFFRLAQLIFRGLQIFFQSKTLIILFFSYDNHLLVKVWIFNLFHLSSLCLLSYSLFKPWWVLFFVWI